MKFFIGFICTLVVLALLAYVVLQVIWDINLVDPEHIGKSLKTLGILAVGATLLTLIISFFFRNNRKGYGPGNGGVAQPKR